MINMTTTYQSIKGQEATGKINVLKLCPMHLEDKIMHLVDKIDVMKELVVLLDKQENSVMRTKGTTKSTTLQLTTLQEDLAHSS
jgi:hypothetical protein